MFNKSSAFIFYFLLSLLIFSCKKETSSNQVGTWEVREKLTITHDGDLFADLESSFTIKIKSNGTGVQIKPSYEDLFDWTISESGTQITIAKETIANNIGDTGVYNILTDLPDKQIWQLEKESEIFIFSGESHLQKSVYYWELNKK